MLRPNRYARITERYGKGKGLAYRLDALERAIPLKLPPCSVIVAGKVWALWLEKTGLNPNGFSGTEFDFMFSPGPTATLTEKDLIVLSPNDEDYFQENKGKALAWWKGHNAGHW